MTLATSKNLTIGGIAAILTILATGLTQYAQGGIANIQWGVLLPALFTAVVAILAKGSASTGGTVDGAGNPVTK
jgi:hypothetical protein